MMSISVPILLAGTQNVNKIGSGHDLSVSWRLEERPRGPRGWRRGHSSRSGNLDSGYPPRRIPEWRIAARKPLPQLLFLLEWWKDEAAEW